MGAIYYKREAEYVPGAPFMGGGERALENDDAYGAIRALDATTGKLRWEFRQHTPPWSGVMSTAGGLILSAPISFAVDGRQHVAIATNDALVVFAR